MRADRGLRIADRKSVALGEVAEVNPAWFDDCIDSDEEVAFVPMAAVSAETANIERLEVRKLGDVLQGFPWFMDGDVLVAKITPCFENGKIVQARITQRYGFGSTEFHVLSPGENLDARYLLHFLRQGHVRIDGARKMTGSAGQRRVPKYFLERLEIPLPPLAEQRRIAEVLDRAEALRAKRRAALAQLDSLTQSLFLDLFGDPATNPKGFPKVELGQVVKLVGGYAFKSEDFAAEGNAVVRISNLTGDGIDLDGIARIPDEKLGKGVGYKIHRGDILIAMSGATTGKLGVVPLELSEDLYLNQRVGNYRIRDAARIQREFLIGLLRSPFYQRFLWQLAAGVAQPNVSGWQLESAVVALPPIPLQREFARRVTAVEALKTAQGASLAELDALFATLQHRAFRGEL